MTTYPYQPPARQFVSTYGTFRDWVLAGQWSALVEPDPLGSVNKIVTLMNGDRRIRSRLWPVRPDSDVRAVYDQGSGYTYGGPGWRALTGGVDPEPQPYRPPSWCVEVDGRRVIEVPEHETWPARTPPPPVPLWRRGRDAVRRRVRAGVDAVAERLGFHRASECGGDW